MLLEQLRTIDKQRLDKYVGRLDKKQLAELDYALAISLDLKHHIPDALIMSLCSVCADNFRNTGAEAMILLLCGRNRRPSWKN